MITQMELAKLAEVSQKTVNRALSGHPDVNAETRRRIMEIAEYHGYMPNQAACAVRSGRYGNIGMLIPEDIFSTFVPVELIGNLKKELEPHQMLLLLSCLSDREFTDENLIKNILRKMMCDGILVNYNADFPLRLVELLSRYRLPAVWINSRVESDCVHHDEFAAGITATRHLLELGHRRITYLNFSGLGHHSRVDRRDGYCQAMREAGLPVDFHESESVNSNLRHQWITRLMESPKRPTAILACLDDMVVLGSIVRGMGLRIPEDLSLITFDIKSKHFLDTILTTMIQQEHLLCQHAVKMLMAKIENPEQGFSPVAIPLRMDAGKTTAAPGGTK